MVTIQKWFGSVEEFLEPLIYRLYPDEGKTVEQTFKSNNGRVIGWLNQSYGYAICRATVEDKNVFTVYSGNSIMPWVDLQSGNAKIYNNRIEAKTVLKKKTT